MAIAKEPEFTEAIETVETDQQLQIPSELSAQKILLHTRILNGKSVNAIFFNVVGP